MPEKIRRLYQGPHTDKELRDYGLICAAKHELYRADPIKGYVSEYNSRGIPQPPRCPELEETALGIIVRRHPLALLHQHPELSKPWSHYRSNAPLDLSHRELETWSALHIQAWLTLSASTQRKKSAENEKPAQAPGPDFMTAGGAAL